MYEHIFVRGWKQRELDYIAAVVHGDSTSTITVTSPTGAREKWSLPKDLYDKLSKYKSTYESEIKKRKPITDDDLK